nr:helix-turn-helix domain-containing protein [Moritella viscosa]SHO17733.1 Resolvase domain-containing protein [Moritella viscosa]
MKIVHSKLNKRTVGRPQKYSNKEQQEIRNLYAQGYNQTSISAATGIPQRSISLIVNRKE